MRANRDALGRLTAVLLDQQAQYRRAPASQRTARLTVLRELARERKARFIALANQQSSACLQVAMASALRQQLPPEVAAEIERSAMATGQLDIAIADYPDGHSEVFHQLRDAQGQVLFLHPTSPLPSQAVTGTTVQISGLQLGQDVVPSRISVLAARTPLPAALSTKGEQKVLVILVNFSDNPIEPRTPDQIRDTVFNRVDAFYQEVSYGQTWLTGKVVGWYTIPHSSPGPTWGYRDLFNAAMQAARGSISFRDYTHLVVIFPPTPFFEWSGYGFIGTTTINTPDGPIQGSYSWINGDFRSQPIAHELGHGLGLHHDNVFECGDLPMGTVECREFGMRHPFDTMNSISFGHFTAAFKDQLGWFAPANVQVVDPAVGGTYALAPLEVSSSVTQALKIPTTGPDGPAWYYIEYRRPLGFDADVASRLQAPLGVFVTMASKIGATAQLLDATPDSHPSDMFDDFLDAELTVEKPFADQRGLMIRLVNQDEAGAMVEVRTVPPGEIPQVSVTSPIAGATLLADGRSFDIEGTATGATVAQYQLAYALQELPVHWTAIDQPIGQQVVNGRLGSWTLSHLTAGDYWLRLLVTTQDQAKFRALVPLTIEAPPNRPPEVSLQPAEANQTIPEGGLYQLNVSATDPDGDPITLTARQLNGSAVSALGAAWTDHGDGTGTLMWTPHSRQAGRYNLVFSATDGKFLAQQSVRLIVQESTLAISGEVLAWNTGRPVPNVAMHLHSPSTAVFGDCNTPALQQTMTDSAGRFLFEGISSGRYLVCLEAASPSGISPMSRSVLVNKRDRVRLSLRVTAP